MGRGIRASSGIGIDMHGVDPELFQLPDRQIFIFGADNRTFPLKPVLEYLLPSDPFVYFDEIRFVPMDEAEGPAVFDIPELFAFQGIDRFEAVIA